LVAFFVELGAAMIVASTIVPAFNSNRFSLSRATHNLLLLPGDGIGPEVMAEVKRVIDFFNTKGPDTFTTDEALAGGGCYDAHGVAITDATVSPTSRRP